MFSPAEIERKQKIAALLANRGAAPGAGMMAIADVLADRIATPDVQVAELPMDPPSNPGIVDPMILDRIEREMAREGAPYGTDGYYTERTDRVIDEHEPEQFYKYPLQRSLDAVGMSHKATPEQAEQYNQMGLQGQVGTFNDMAVDPFIRLDDALQNNNPGEQFDPNLMEGIGVDPRGMFGQEDARFDDANAYQVADMSNVPPAGAGEKSKLNATARAFQGMMKSLQDYESVFKEGGSTMWPGARKDTLDTAHRDLQMQMKELYNLGVLNGPDLDLMNQILLSPTSIGGNIMDAVGIADMEKRIPENIENVRRMMLNRATPGLQQIGINPQDLLPKTAPGEMSDDELKKALGLN